MIFDSAENVAISEPEPEAAQQNARRRLRVWRRRALYCTGSFVLNCALICPFLEGHSLHAYWESFGKYLILLSLALMLASLYSVLLLWGAWRLLRDLESGHI